MEVRTNETISVTDIQRRAKEVFERIERGEQDRFVVLKNNEIRQFGEYRTQRLVLEAWDRLLGG